MVLGILFKLNLDAGYIYSRFSKTLLEKSLIFVTNKKNNIIVFNLSLMLLLAKIDLIPEKQSYKKDVFMICGTGYNKIVFALLKKKSTLYISFFNISQGFKPWELYLGI